LLRWRSGLLVRERFDGETVTKTGDDLLLSLNEALAYARGQGPATVHMFEDTGANGWQKIQPEDQTKETDPSLTD
jgi:hypothetical protein